MRKMNKMVVFILMVFVIFAGSAWGGWFSFEPNLVLQDGTAVGRYLEDIEAANEYLAKGDKQHADELISDQKVYLIKADQDQTRVEYLDYKEHGGNVFIHVKDETGTKVWANMTGLVCMGPDGKEKKLTKEEVEKGEFKPLP